MAAQTAGSREGPSALSNMHHHETHLALKPAVIGASSEVNIASDRHENLSENVLVFRDLGHANRIRQSPSNKDSP